MYMMFLLNLPALVEPIPAPSTGTPTFSNVRILTAVMSFLLIASMHLHSPLSMSSNRGSIFQILLSPLSLQLSKKTIQPLVCRRSAGFSFLYPCSVSPSSFIYLYAVHRSTRSLPACGSSSLLDKLVAFSPLLVLSLGKGIFRSLPPFSTRSGSHV